MRSRIFALLILILLFTVPVGLYWYFIISARSSIEVQGVDNMRYIIHLQGTFHVKFLPLADTVLNRAETCSDVCILSGIMPTEYTYSVTATGYDTLEGTINIRRGEKKTLKLSFREKVRTHAFSQTSSDMDIQMEFLRNNTDSLEGKEILGNDGEHIWLMEEHDRGVAISRVTKEGEYIAQFQVPGVKSRGYIDGSNSYIIFQRGNSTEIYGLRDGRKYILPGVYKVQIIRENENLSVTTASGLFVRRDDDWGENPLFDDVVIGKNMSLGLVRSAEKKHILGIPENKEDAIYMINQSTKERRKILENVSASYLFSEGGHIGYVLANGEKIEILGL